MVVRVGEEVLVVLDICSAIDLALDNLVSGDRIIARGDG